MEFELTRHAKLRLKERNISEILLSEAINHPTKIGRDSYGNILFKKLYKKSQKSRLLLIAGIKVKGK